MIQHLTQSVHVSQLQYFSISTVECSERLPCSATDDQISFISDAAKPCSAPAKVDNAVILTEFQNIYLSGSEVIYVCRRDYTGQKTEIRCTEGKWEKTTLNCTGTFNLSFH